MTQKIVISNSEGTELCVLTVGNSEHNTKDSGGHMSSYLIW